MNRMNRGTGERHSARQHVSPAEKGDLSVARQMTAHRQRNPTRTSAGICKSCDCPIDAMTGECGCSA